MCRLPGPDHTGVRGEVRSPKNTIFQTPWQMGWTRLELFLALFSHRLSAHTTGHEDLHTSPQARRLQALQCKAHKTALVVR